MGPRGRPFRLGPAGPGGPQGESRKDSMAEFTDYVVADISLAAWGEEAINTAWTSCSR